MYHSVIFDGLDAYETWNIVPAERPVISTPSQKTQTLDIPGADGSLDVSDVLTGHPTFNNRTGSIEFIVLNDEIDYNWVKKRDEFIRFLHAKRHKVILEDDPNYYYYGKTTAEWSTQKDWSRLTVNYEFEPYKYGMVEYEVDIVPNLSFGVSKSFFGDMPFDPTFTRLTNPEVEVGVTIATASKYVETVLHPGDTKLYEMNVYQEDVTFAFSGNSKLRMSFRKGVL